MTRRAGRPFAAILAASLAALVYTLAGALDRADATARPAAGHGPFSGRVAIRGGRKLYLECRGSGRPLVMLEAGTGDLGRIWTMPPFGSGPPVLPAVARYTRVCAYDRPGTYELPDTLSRSDPVAMPRTARDIVRDLHALLRAAGARRPYVLAGHSFGGMVARLYATTHPQAVAGLVSVDAQNEDYADAYRHLLTPDQYQGVLDPQAPPGLDYPAAERLDLEPSAAQMRQAQADTPLRAMPLVVLSHSQTLPNPFGFPPDWPAAELEQAFQRSQDMLTRLVPGARHVIAARSGHYIQLDQPKLVTRAIRSVVAAARDGRARAD